jgi:hypothetical protein
MGPIPTTDKKRSRVSGAVAAAAAGNNGKVAVQFLYLTFSIRYLKY